MLNVWEDEDVQSETPKCGVLLLRVNIDHMSSEGSTGSKIIHIIVLPSSIEQNKTDREREIIIPCLYDENVCEYPRLIEIFNRLKFDLCWW